MIPIKTRECLKCYSKKRSFNNRIHILLDLDPFKDLAVNEEINYQLAGDLNIVGLSENLTISVSVRKLDDDKFHVSNNGFFFLDPAALD